MTADTGATEPSDASGSDAAPRRAGRLQRSVEVALWVVVLGLVVWRFGPQAGAALGLRAGTEPAPDFVVQTLAGDSVRLSELRGKVVLINFWATWCPPCRIEMPGFQRVWEDYADCGLVIVGLSVDRGVRSDVARWVDGRGLTFPSRSPRARSFAAMAARASSPRPSSSILRVALPIVSRDTTPSPRCELPSVASCPEPQRLARVVNGSPA